MKIKTIWEKVNLKMSGIIMGALVLLVIATNFYAAESLLGDMYYKGNIVSQDYRAAAKWYGYAAEGGYAPAQYRLALMYEDGKGVISDNLKAGKWVALAAEQGHAGAQYNFANRHSYRGGSTTLQNLYIKAMWCHLSKLNGGRECSVDVYEYCAAAIEGYTDKKFSEMESCKRSFNENSFHEKAKNMARECLAKNYKGC